MLKEVTAVYVLESGKRETYRGWLDAENETIFFLAYSISGDGLNMSGYKYDAENDVYDVTTYPSLMLATLDDENDFTSDHMAALYKRMKSVSVYDYLRLHFDRTAEYQHNIERL